MGIANVGWRYFLMYIISGYPTAIRMRLYFLDTLVVPLEEISAVFGDAGALQVACCGFRASDIG